MKTTLLFTLAFMVQLGWSQQTVEHEDHLTCKHNKQYEEYCKKNNIDPYNNPDYLAYEKMVADKMAAFKTKKSTRAGGPPQYIIPVVFHVIHVGGAENISDDQIYDALAILNRDYRKLNADTADVVSAFAGIVADCEIEFRLAQKDALGNCVSGITRTFSSTTNVGDESTVDAVNMNLNGSTSTAGTRFPHDMYLNVWIVKNASGAAGYTNTPFGALFNDPEYDGIWINHGYVGSIGTSTVTKSRALTHEVGHWLNLSHVWGNTNNPGVSCGDDSVGDTPETEGWSSCNLAGATCGNPIDNVQNYMEYSYCSRMFTEGQKARMLGALAIPISGRDNLSTPANLAAAGVDGPDNLCAADFSSDAVLICAGDSIQFTDASYHGANSWNWSFGSGTPSTSTNENPMITFNTQGQFSVDLSVSDGSSTVSTTKTNYITVLDPVGASLPFSEGFESITSLPTPDWFLTNFDGQETWEIASGLGSSGTKCMKLNNFDFNATGGKDQFTSQTFDASMVTNVGITFKYAYRQRATGDNEKLKLFISNSCGQSWILKKQVAGSALSGSLTQATNFTPGAGDWMEFTTNVSTATFLTQGFMIRIEFESDQGNNIYIDDINMGQGVGLSEEEDLISVFDIFPNPFNTSATIQYSLLNNSPVEVNITNLMGQVIYTEKQENKAAGEHQLKLTAEQLKAKGVYFVNIKSGNTVKTKKIVLQ